VQNLGYFKTMNSVNYIGQFVLWEQWNQGGYNGAGHVAQMEKKRNAYQFFVGKPLRKWPPCRTEKVMRW